MKTRLNSGKRPNLYFLRDYRGFEIDLMIETPSRAAAIEIKSGATIASDYMKNLAVWRELSSTPTSETFLIYGGDERQKRRDGMILSWRSLKELHNLVVS